MRRGIEGKPLTRRGSEPACRVKCQCGQTTFTLAAGLTIVMAGGSRQELHCDHCGKTTVILVAEEQ